jgi:hypothetical protein
MLYFPEDESQFREIKIHKGIELPPYQDKFILNIIVVFSKLMMRVKNQILVKEEVKMPDKKAAPAKGTTKKVAKGDAYSCGVCGLVVTVDETCGCVDTCDIICCNEPMKPKKTATKVKAS